LGLLPKSFGPLLRMRHAIRGALTESRSDATPLCLPSAGHRAKPKESKERKRSTPRNEKWMKRACR